MEVQNENNGNFLNLFVIPSEHILKISGTEKIISFCSEAEQKCFSDQDSFNTIFV